MSDFIGTKLTMNLGERSYDIIVKRGSLENLYQFARLDRRVAVVTDSGVPAQYAQMVADSARMPPSSPCRRARPARVLKFWRPCCGRCWTSAWAGATLW